MNISLNCTQCKKPFERSLREYNSKQLKRKSKPFCSRGCATIHRNLHTSKTDYVKRNPGLKNYSNNRLDEYSPFKFFISKSNTRSKNKNQRCDLDVEYLKQLWEVQNGICPYTALRMELCASTAAYEKSHSLKKASLDRIDSQLGYVRGNVEFVCLAINLAKNNYTKEEFLSFINEIKTSHP